MASAQNRSSGKNSVKLNGGFIGSVFLGICLIVGSFKISGAIKGLSTSVKEQTFASQLNSPSSISVDMAGVEKNYLTLEEAGEYLHVSPDKIASLISAGEITEYVKTDSGYSISVKDLDDWFENEVYKRTMQKNAESAENKNTDQ